MVPSRRAVGELALRSRRPLWPVGAARVAKRRLRRLADIRRLRREVELVCPAIHHLRAGLGRDISRDLSWLGPARWLASEVGRIRGRFAATIVRCHDDDSARNPKRLWISRCLEPRPERSSSPRSAGRTNGVRSLQNAGLGCRCKATCGRRRARHLRKPTRVNTLNRSPDWGRFSGTRPGPGGLLDSAQAPRLASLSGSRVDSTGCPGRNRHKCPESLGGFVVSRARHHLTEDSSLAKRTTKPLGSTKRRFPCYFRTRTR